MLPAMVALLFAGSVYADVLPLGPPQKPSTSEQFWPPVGSVRYWVSVVEPVVPEAVGGKFLYSRAATEFGNACSTAARNSGDSTVMVCGVAAVIKRSPCSVRKKNNLSLTIGP